MKEVLFLCPNISMYANLRDELKYQLSTKIKEFLQPFIKNEFTVKYLVEDEFANLILETIECKKNPITCVEESDKVFNELHPELNIFKAMFSNANQIHSANVKFPSVNIRDFSDKQDFFKARAELAKKRTKANTQNLLEQSPYTCAIYARHNTPWKSLTESVYTGDGRLYTELDIVTELPSFYYGGFWIEKDVVEDILTIEGGL